MWEVLKSLKNNCQAKKSFIVCGQAKTLVIKSMNKFLSFGIDSKMKKMKEYHDLYLKCEVLLLANVLEKFWNGSLSKYWLCRCHYLSAPALSWDGMVNMTKDELDAISDVDMYLFFEKGMRGWYSYISKWHSKVNNKYLKSYDPKQESKHNIYINANNLYGYAV